MFDERPATVVDHGPPTRQELKSSQQIMIDPQLREAMLIQELSLADLLAKIRSERERNPLVVAEEEASEQQPSAPDLHLLEDGGELFVLYHDRALPRLRVNQSAPPGVGDPATDGQTGPHLIAAQ